MTNFNGKLCWICEANPANSGEHRFKASDIRKKFPRVSQKTPIYLQRDGRNTNKEIGSAKADALKFSDSICRPCNNNRTQPYDVAWEKLSSYLHENWTQIRRLRRFNLSRPFPGTTRSAALDVHLYFLKLFGCKIVESGTAIDLGDFRHALMNRVAHRDICLQLADASPYATDVLAHDHDIYTVHNQRNELDGATWGYRIHPVTVKVHWIRRGVPLYVPGSTWHPGRPSRIVRLSRFKGAIEPSAGSGAWINDPN